MQKKILRKIKKWSIIVALIYLAGGFALYFFQDKLLFRAEPLPPAYRYEFPIPFEETNLLFNEKKNLSIIRFTVPDSVRKGVVLYFHGNKRNVERYAPFAGNFTRSHYEVWMIDYPGFGKSTGKRTEDIMYNDAIELYKMANARFSKDSIIIYGKSLGTGVAAHLAAVRDCKRLLLETPYYSLDNVIKRYAFIYPVSWISKYHFPVYKDFENIRVPITIFHGTGDGTIPYSNSERLMKLARKGDELVTMPEGEHNNLTDYPIYHQKLDSLLR